MPGELAWSQRAAHELMQSSLFTTAEVAGTLAFPDLADAEEESERIRGSHSRLVLVCELGLAILRKLTSKLTANPKPGPVS